MTAGLRLPDYGSGSLADVLPAVLRGLGVEGPPEAAARLGLSLDVSDRVVLVLVDGLGADALEEHAAEAPFMTALRQRPGSRTITSVFPTTTPIALTSLGTGLTPGEHGITGLLMRLPDRSQVFTLALPSPVDLSTLQPKPTAFERAAAAGVAVTRVGPKRFDGDGLTQAGLRGGRYAPAESVGERVTETIAAVREHRPVPDLRLLRRPRRDRTPPGLPERRVAGRAAGGRRLRRAARRRAAAGHHAARHVRPRDGGHRAGGPLGRGDDAGAGRAASSWSAATCAACTSTPGPGATDDVVAAWRATIGGVLLGRLEGRGDHDRALRADGLRRRPGADR